MTHDLVKAGFNAFYPLSKGKLCNNTYDILFLYE